MPDAITLTPGQRQALEAVVSEHAESRRPVKLLIVQAWCNAKSDAAQDLVAEAVGHLRHLGLVKLVAKGIEPTPAGIQQIQQAPARPEPPAPPPMRDGRGGEAGRISAPRAKPIESGFKKRAAQRAEEGIKTCRHCRIQFRRPDEAPMPHDRCERCHEEIEASTAKPDPQEAKPCQAAGCDRPALDVPNASLCAPCRDRMKWPEGQSPLAARALAVSPELLDRCAAMHLSLLEQARTAYEQGDEAAGRELRWLLETGEQLVAAGGEV